MCQKCTTVEQEIANISVEILGNDKPVMRNVESDAIEGIAKVTLVKTGSAKAALQLAFNVAYELGRRRAVAEAARNLEKLDKKMEVM